MRLNDNDYFDNIGINELSKCLKVINEFNLNESISHMKEKLKEFERTRNFQIWHDASVIANHGHILFCVNIVYDPAVFFTSEELKEKTGELIDIQKVVGTLELYIIGRCKSNDEKLGYIETC